MGFLGLMSPGLLVSQTFFATCVGPQIPVLVELLISTCGRQKFAIDSLGDHVSTCTDHLGANNAHDWTVDQLADLFDQCCGPGAIGTGPTY
jgi:hypothetical protein